MKQVHLRFDEGNDMHCRLTLFIDGASTGNLCCSPADAIWFHHMLEKGCRALSPPGSVPIEFIASGTPPSPPSEQMDAAVNPYLVNTPDGRSYVGDAE